MKKYLALTFLSFIFLSLLLLLFSWLSGSGIRISDGRYLGYSSSTDEMLFIEYQNTLVKQDGPYVITKGEKHLAINITSTEQQINQVTTTQVQDQVVVTADNKNKTQFSVPLRNNYARSNLIYSTEEKVLAISDIEGNFNAMVDLLSASGVINESLAWSFNKGHLVLIGDMVDRGINVLPTLWLIYKLEAEAEKVGGKVHFILGNHERYLLDGRTKSVAKKYYGSYRATNMTQRQLWSDNTVLGAWLRSKPILLKINETVFVHGGVSPQVLAQQPSIELIDKLAAKSFVTSNTVVKNSEQSILHSSQGLLFYRGLAKDMSHYGLGNKASAQHIEQVLSFYEAEKIAIGHTLSQNIGFDYQEKVIRVDVDHAGGNSEALLIDNNNYYRVNNRGEAIPLQPLPILGSG